jgi:hypothetical protein
MKGKKMAEILGHTYDGFAVVPRYSAHDHRLRRDLLAAALARVHTRGRRFLKKEISFPQVVGMTTCVETSGDDEVGFAPRPNRAGQTRWVFGRQPEECNSVCCILMRGQSSDQDKYVLVTAFIGRNPEPEPWDFNALRRDPRGYEAALAAALKFWGRGPGPGHALVWGSEPAEPHSLSYSCPW